MDTSFDFCCGCEPTSLYHWRFLFWYSRQRYGLFHSPHLRWGIKILFHLRSFFKSSIVIHYFNGSHSVVQSRLCSLMISPSSSSHHADIPPSLPCQTSWQTPPPFRYHPLIIRASLQKSFIFLITYIRPSPPGRPQRQSIMRLCGIRCKEYICIPMCCPVSAFIHKRIKRA